MSDNDDWCELKLQVPHDQMDKLRVVAQEQYGETPENLARFWLLDKIRGMDSRPNFEYKSATPVQLDNVQTEDSMPLIGASTNRKKVRSAVESNWGSGEPFSRQELITAVQSRFPEVKASVILPADRAINQKSGYHKEENEYIKQEPYLFKLPNGKFVIYDSSIHGKYKCIDQDGHKTVVEDINE